MTDPALALFDGGIGRDRLAPLMASLPLSYRLTGARAEADVVAVGSANELRNGGPTPAVATVLFDPGASDALQLGSNKPLIVSETYAGNPALLQVADRLYPLVDAVQLVEVTSSSLPDVSQREDVLFQQLRVLRRLGFALRDASILVPTRSGFVLQSALTHGAPVQLSAVLATTGRPSMRVDVHVDGQQVTVDLESSSTARPAVVRWLTTEQDATSPTVYETAHRATLLRIHATAPAPASTDLTALARDAAAAKRLSAASGAELPLADLAR